MNLQVNSFNYLLSAHSTDLDLCYAEDETVFIA